MRVGGAILITRAPDNHNVHLRVHNTKIIMADHERQQRQRLLALQNNHQLARFTVQGRATGKQLGTGSYGSVEEVASYVLRSSPSTIYV